MTNPEILTISEFTLLLKGELEGRFPLVWVQGEISKLTRAASGHVYLTLKDANAQLKAILWKQSAMRLKFQPRDGLQVIAAGYVEVYEARGQYQLIIQELLPQGMGPLELAFRQLHDKLAAEGLFDAERKRPYPRFPRRIALITSPTGAAVKDMLQVITRRWRGADIVIVPVPVQGEEAAPKIAAALRSVHLIPNVDVVIAGRGGGSLEDLWPFNEEVVARAIHACRLPVISAVGHEIDVTIADLVADRRALTPSEAGELVVPKTEEVRAEVDRLRQRLIQALQSRAKQARLQLENLANRRVFTRPRERIHDAARQLDEWAERAERAIQQRLERERQLVDGLGARLEALSPLRTLQRGYSVTLRQGTREVLRDPNDVQPGEMMTTLLASGKVHSRVEAVEQERNVER